jgi:hypothetical protein
MTSELLALRLAVLSHTADHDLLRHHTAAAFGDLAEQDNRHWYLDYARQLLIEGSHDRVWEDLMLIYNGSSLDTAESTRSVAADIFRRLVSWYAGSGDPVLLCSREARRIEERLDDLGVHDLSTVGAVTEYIEHIIVVRASATDEGTRARVLPEVRRRTWTYGQDVHHVHGLARVVAFSMGRMSHLFEWAASDVVEGLVGGAA